MQEMEKSNVVQFRDYARQVNRTGTEPVATCVGSGQRAAILAWPRKALYPGGIDDLPI